MCSCLAFMPAEKVLPSQVQNKCVASTNLSLAFNTQIISFKRGVNIIFDKCIAQVCGGGKLLIAVKWLSSVTEQFIFAASVVRRQCSACLNLAFLACSARRGSVGWCFEAQRVLLMHTSAVLA